MSRIVAYACHNVTPHIVNEKRRFQIAWHHPCFPQVLCMHLLSQSVSKHISRMSTVLLKYVHKN